MTKNALFFYKSDRTEYGKQSIVRKISALNSDGREESTRAASSSPSKNAQTAEVWFDFVNSASGLPEVKE